MTRTKSRPITIHTDGSCLGNPGPGGWAFHITDGTHEKLVSGFSSDTTNNRMELLAAIQALDALTRDYPAVTVVTDSNYVRHGITDWLPNWKANGWKTSDRKPVKNGDLWLRLEGAAARHPVTWRWCRAHSGVPENELVDTAARKAAENQSGEKQLRKVA